MFFKSAVVFAAIVAVSGAAIQARSALDVFSPHITSPTSNTVWIQGTKQNVTWSTADAPANISNKGIVTLEEAIGGSTFTLAEGFDLRSGHVEVTVPEGLRGGSDWQITLFGDSGNKSEFFVVDP